MKIISMGSNHPKNNWWNPIFEKIEMEALIVCDDGEAIKADNLCIVEEVIKFPYLQNACSYWFVVRYRPVDQSHGLRDCELVFNTYHEAGKVKRGSIFNKADIEN